MTPDDFAAILATRTPGQWRHDNNRMVFTDGPHGIDGTERVPATAENQDALLAAVNLAPLLLDLWRAVLRDFYPEGFAPTALEDDIDRALAALEAAE